MLTTKIFIAAILFTLIFAFCKADLYLSNQNVTEVCVMKEESCEVLTDLLKIKELFENNTENFVMISDGEFAEIKATCFLSSRFWNEKYGFLYPGTLWCGRGSKAANYSELGVHSKEDSCCRDHDNCPSSLTSGQCKGGICNPSKFTRSHCECDRKFQECLRNSGTETGNTIGAIFFNIAQIFCFEETRKCPNTARIMIEETPRRDSCPFLFQASARYTFSKPNYTDKNWKAYYFNWILRKIGLAKK